MAVRHGYGKVATEGLVFAYDTGDTVNSYKGEPTENIHPEPQLNNWDIRQADLTYTDDYVEIRTTASDNYSGIHDTINVVSGSTYTMSYYYKHISGTPRIGGHVNTSATIRIDRGTVSNNTFTDVPDDGEYHLVEETFTMGTSGNLSFYIQPGRGLYEETVGRVRRGGKYGVQFEEKDHATPFVNGTRSVSGSLLDLTGNSTIDLTNTGFDSDAQIVFDGTDNSAAITGLTISAQQDKSYEAVIRVPVGHNQTGTIIGGQQNTSNVFQIQSNEIIRAGEDDEFIFASSSISVGEWHHVAYTFEFDGTDAYQKLYLDGEITSERTKITFIDTYIESTQYLGYEYRFNEYFNGDISVCKVYNRALTADEVRNNYRHYKNRFNI